MRPADITRIARVDEVRLDPSATRVAFTVTTIDGAANRYRTRIWVGPADGSSRPRPVTAGEWSDTLPRWSPDGTSLAFVSDRGGAPAGIWVLPVDGPGEATLVCRRPDRISELAWSPDGASIAFVGRDPDPARRNADGTDRPVAEQPPRRITRLFARLNGEDWVVDRPELLYVVPVDGSAPPQPLLAGPTPVGSPAWSPDGTRLAFVSARHDDWDLDFCNDIWTIDADGVGPAVQLTDTSASWSALAWSPDGTSIAYLEMPTPDDEPRHFRLGVLDVVSGKRRRLAAGLDRNLAPYGHTRPPVWDGERLLFTVEDCGAIHVHAVHLHTGHADAGHADAGPAEAVHPTEDGPGDDGPTSLAGDGPTSLRAGDGPTSLRAGDGRTWLVAGGDRVVHNFDAVAGAVVLAWSAPLQPSEVSILPAGGVERALTSLSTGLAGAVSLTPPDRFVTRHADGTEVDCWAVPPAGARPGERYPTIVNIHGGPFSSYGWPFFDEFQIQSGAGFGVVYCNPRGSSGYTEAWGRAIRWPEAAVDPGSGWGGVDYDDVMACTEEACRRFDWIDGDRLGVQGGSYGGYLTSWIVGHTTRFVAACSERAVNNLQSLEYESDISGTFRAYVGADHVTRPDLYARQSPATYVHDMHTPMLLLHSEGDLRCPIGQAEELFVALRLLGRKPELVRFPGEDHELSRHGSPRHRIQRAEIILEWFTRHLCGGPDPAT
jgi:dipeptidyl aminopeptidase/acylaminoacyl peptidase